MGRIRLRLVALIFAVVLAVFVAWRSLLVVDESSAVLLTNFGEPAVLYNVNQREAGLHLKWPWQSVLAVDRRIQIFSPRPREVITGDKKNLEVVCLVIWQVVDPARFLRAAGSLEAAEQRLEERVSAAVSDAIGQRRLDQLITTDPGVRELEQMTEMVRVGLDTKAQAELGVSIRDVQLSRFNHPLEVRPAVFDLIRSERGQVAAELRAQGEAAYQTIASQADRDRDQILAEAEAEAERIKAEGQAEATRLLNEAHALDPEFAVFLRTLETYRAILDGQSTLILSSESPLLRLLNEGPASLSIAPPRDEMNGEPPIPSPADSDSSVDASTQTEFSTPREGEE